MENFKNLFISDDEYINLIVENYPFDKCYELAHKCTNMTTFKTRHNDAYLVAVNYNWLDEITQHFTYKSKVNKPKKLVLENNGLPKIPKPINYWTKEQCFIEYQKYGSVHKLKLYARGAYNAIYKNKWSREFNKTS